MSFSGGQQSNGRLGQPRDCELSVMSCASRGGSNSWRGGCGAGRWAAALRFRVSPGMAVVMTMLITPAS